jgi:hypothetical protein
MSYETAKQTTSVNYPKLDGEMMTTHADTLKVRDVKYWIEMYSQPGPLHTDY